MKSAAEMHPLFSSSSEYAKIVFFSVAVTALICALTYSFTYVRYYFVLSHHLSSIDSRDKIKSKKVRRPARLPYAFPVIGLAFSFLTPLHGKFWEWLMCVHPPQVGAVTALIGGRTMIFLSSPAAVAALFKCRHTDRILFIRQVLEWGLGLSKKDSRKYFGLEPVDPAGIPERAREATLRYADEEDVMLEFALKTERVSELTAGFLKALNSILAEEEIEEEEERMQSSEKRKNERETKGELIIECDLWTFLRRVLFKATVTAFLGSRVLEIYPDLEADYFAFDSDMLKMFFGFPRVLIPKGYAARDRLVRGLMWWHQSAMDECGGAPADPMDDPWEPLYGSRCNRARQYMYYAKGASTAGRAALDAGFLFALGSNVVPATAWMLFHILDPRDPDLKGEIEGEVKTALQPDGSLNHSSLAALPLLASVYREMLRYYVDFLVSREMLADVDLPLDESGKILMRVRKGELIVAPTYLSHRAKDTCMGDEAAPASNFNPRRYAPVEKISGLRKFSTEGQNSHAYFPFGGGKSACPGRAFARQEVLAAVSAVLNRYEIEVLGFRNAEGNETEEFPPIGPGYPGVAVCNIGGDMRVRLHRRKRKKIINAVP